MQTVDKKPFISEKYLPHTWADPRLEMRPSPIDGKGIFAKKDIRKGELLMIWGGVLIDQEEYTDHWEKYRHATLVQIDEEHYIGLLATDTSESIDEYLNHSCDPNSWLMDEVTVVARGDINAGEEVTMDSALWNDDEDEDYSQNGQCSCGSLLCRKKVTPNDWKLPELQKRYEGHFSPFIVRRIQRERRRRRKMNPVKYGVMLILLICGSGTGWADWQMISYGGAVHSFTVPDAGGDPSTGAAYNADADRRSWQALRAFFDEIFISRE